MSAASLDLFNTLSMSPSGLSYAAHLVPATGTDRLTYSGSRAYEPVIGRRASIDYSASASMGSLGMAFSVSALCNIQGCGVEALNQSNEYGALSASEDTLSITGAASGYLGLNVSLRGYFSAENVAQSRVTYSLQTYSTGGSAIARSNLLARFEERSTPTTSDVSQGYLGYSNGDFADYAPVVSGVGWIANVRGTLFVRFLSGEVMLTQRLTGGYLCNGMRDYPCAAAANFSEGARIGEAVVYDDNMNRVLGAVVSSASGYDYSSPVSQAPEPANLFLSLTGLLLIALKYRRKMSFSVPFLSCPTL